MRKRRSTKAHRSTAAVANSFTPWSLWTIALAFTIIALGMYWSCLHNPLVFDDRVLRDDFLTYYGTALFRFDLRWLSYASFGWTYDIVGKQWLWHRLINVMLHAGTAFLLFRFLISVYSITLGNSADTPSRWYWAAALGSLLFLLHPVTVYGVAYLAQRSIVMATLCSLLCLWLFLEGLSSNRTRWMLYAAVGAYFAAVFSKEHCVMLPAVAFALAVLVRGPSLHSLRDLALPFVLFAAIAILITLRTKGLLGSPYEPLAGEILSQLSGPEGRSDVKPTLALSILNQGHLFFRYLLLWIVPYPGWMSIDLRPTFPLHLASWPHSIGFAAWIIWFGYAVTQLRKGGICGLLGFAMLFPWLLALTEMGTIRVQEPLVLYRSYLWMCVTIAMLPLLLLRIPLKWACAGMALTCALLAISTQDRLATFKSALALWDDVVRHNRDSSAPLIERGYHNRGFAYLQNKQYPKALADFSKAIEINPFDANALVGRGTLHTRLGSHERAIEDLNRATAIDPRYAEAYAKRCYVRMMQGNPSLALSDCEQAVVLNPRHREALTNQGVVYAALNRPNDAADSYRRALAIDSTNPDAHYNLGVLYIAQNRIADAQPHLKSACSARIRAACDMLPAVAYENSQ